MSPADAAIERYKHAEAALRRMARQAALDGRKDDYRDLMRAARHAHMAMFREKRGDTWDQWERTYPFETYRRVA